MQLNKKVVVLKRPIREDPGDHLPAGEMLLTVSLEKTTWDIKILRLLVSIPSHTGSVTESQSFYDGDLIVDRVANGAIGRVEFISMPNSTDAPDFVQYIEKCPDSHLLKAIWATGYVACEEAKGIGRILKNIKERFDEAIVGTQINQLKLGQAPEDVLEKQLGDEVRWQPTPA